MNGVCTLVTTIVSLSRPIRSQPLLSEKLLLTQDLISEDDINNEGMEELRHHLYNQDELIALGKLVPNMIRN